MQGAPGRPGPSGPGVQSRLRSGRCEIDEELNRRYVELEQAEREWREHRQSAWTVWYGNDAQSAIGTATANPWTREWREREESLRAAFAAAREAWLSYLPPL